MKRVTSLNRLIYDFLIDHWVLSTILFNLVPIGFILIQYYGVYLKIYTIDNSLTKLGIYTTSSMIILHLLVVFIKSLSDNHEKFSKEHGYEVLSNLDQSIDSVVLSKNERFLNYIHSRKDDSIAFKSITQPKDQIDQIIKKMQELLSSIFGIEEEMISISIIYRIDENDTWDWFKTFNIEGGLTLNQLLTNPNSTVRNIIDNRHIIVFYPDKKLAIKKKVYVPGMLDDRYDNVGSLYCEKINVTKNDITYMEAILTITTFNKQFCDEKDEYSIHKIQHAIMRRFILRLKLELSLFYIKEVMATKCKDCN